MLFVPSDPEVRHHSYIGLCRYNRYGLVNFRPVYCANRYLYDRVRYFCYLYRHALVTYKGIIMIMIIIITIIIMETLFVFLNV